MTGLAGQELQQRLVPLVGVAGVATVRSAADHVQLAAGDGLVGALARALATSWWLGPSFRARYPRVDLDESRTLVVADTITTAGAALSHVYLALSIVGRRSPALAELVARYFVVGERPTQGAVAVPSVLAGGDPTLSAFERQVRETLPLPSASPTSPARRRARADPATTH